MQAQGFPTLGKELKIINKLNKMAITLSEGWYNTKPGSIISEQANFPKRQQFRIIEKGNSELYFIEMLNKDMVLSTLKGGWGQMIYSDVKLEKFNDEARQLWRIVPYDAVMYNEKTQQKHVFQYNPVIANSIGLKTNSSNTGIQYPNLDSKNEPKTQNASQKSGFPLGYEFESGSHLDHKYETSKVSSSQGTQDVFKLGYEFESGNHLNHKYEASKVSHPGAIFKLGYEFESGPHLNYQYDDEIYKKKVKNDQLQENEYDIPTPVRFPIKQKNNTLPIDKENKGWFFIENVKYNLVLEIEAGIDEPGMSIVLNTMYGNRNQLWKFA